jgi:hypothetical protein
MASPNPIEYFKNLEGRDDFGESKAVSVLQNVVFYQDVDGKVNPSILDQAESTSAVAQFAVTNGRAVICLEFESFDDMEYLRFQRVCQDFTNGAHPSEGGTTCLSLTLAQAGDYDYFMTAPFVMTYVMDGKKPMIKFLIEVNDITMYQLPESIIDLALDEYSEENDDSLSYI